jgi:hypothetical protein
MSLKHFKPITSSGMRGVYSGELDFLPLVNQWADILQKNHRARILAGLDRSESPMPPTQRERNPALAARLGSGPPLAPKYESSRVIRNATPEAFKRGTEYVARLSWPNFTTPKGLDILSLHARPLVGAPYPRRDVITHISPTDRRECSEALRKYLKGQGPGNSGPIPAAAAAATGGRRGLLGWLRGQVRRLFGG